MREGRRKGGQLTHPTNSKVCPAVDVSEMMLTTPSATSPTWCGVLTHSAHIHLTPHTLPHSHRQGVCVCYSLCQGWGPNGRGIPSCLHSNSRTDPHGHRHRLGGQWWLWGTPPSPPPPHMPAETRERGGEGGRGGGGRDEDTSQELPCPHLGLQEAGGGGGVGIQGREVDESLDSGHTTSLCYHPRPIHMHLVVLEVSGEKTHLSASQPASQPASQQEGGRER